MSQYIPPHLRNRTSAKQDPVVSSTIESRSSVGTMASLTRSFHSKPSVVIPSDQDFPVLGASKNKSAQPHAPTHRYSELARSWGIQKKEEEEEKKKQANQRHAEAQRLKEEEEKERRYFKVGTLNATKLIAQSHTREEDALYDLGGKRDEALDLDDNDLIVDHSHEDEDDEETEYDLDADWNRRRHKNDLY